jgi:hypothetical protein
VPLLRSVRSRVLPEGTATLESTIVAHDVLLMEAKDAPEEPENMQVLARFSTFAANVGAGAARASSATSARRIEKDSKCITKERENNKAKPKKRGHARGIASKA